MVCLIKRILLRDSNKNKINNKYINKNSYLKKIYIYKIEWNKNIKKRI